MKLEEKGNFLHPLMSSRGAPFSHFFSATFPSA